MNETSGQVNEFTISFPTWFFPQETGYEPKTTFWEDFSIAEAFGKDGIADTFRRAFQFWKTNYEYLTELCLVLNHKAWYWNNRNDDISQMYVKYFEQAYDFGVKHLKGNELDYFLATLD